ncbi:hypothetical protein CAF53_02590 [Sphingobium sp. LB126]|nr:hypothetical protein CAF53_02590 [Sphingobium sp. LB126]
MGSKLTDIAGLDLDSLDRPTWNDARSQLEVRVEQIARAEGKRPRTRVPRIRPDAMLDHVRPAVEETVNQRMMLLEMGQALGAQWRS